MSRNFTQHINQKITPKKDLPALLKSWQHENAKVVFTNGCFDILHKGHVDYLAKAAELGNKLILGLNTDASVKRLKGPNRPINDEQARATVLSALCFIDAIVLFDEDTPYNLINEIQPDILVKGNDYKPEDIVGYDILKAKGGEVITIDLTQGFSTTGIINKMK